MIGLFILLALGAGALVATQALADDTPSAPKPQLPPGSAPPAASLPPASGTPTAAVPPEVVSQVRDAVLSREPERILVMAAWLDQIGYPQVAAQLRQIAYRLPPSTSPAGPMLASDTVAPTAPNKDEAEAERLLLTEEQPATLEMWAALYRNKGMLRLAQALRDKAEAIRNKVQANGAMRAIEKVVEPERAEERPRAVAAPGNGDAPGVSSAAPVASAATVREKAAQVAERAAEVARRSGPTVEAVARKATEAVAQAADAAAAAARGDARPAQEVARQTTELASTVSSPENLAKAEAVASRAAEAAATGDAQKAAQAAAAAVTLAEDIVRQVAQVPSSASAPSLPSLSLPTAPSPAAALAARVAAEIAAKGCWSEDRKLVAEYQTLRGMTADGMYGPKTAKDMLEFLPSVPPPCYWPREQPSRRIAQKEWSDFAQGGRTTAPRAVA